MVTPNAPEWVGGGLRITRAALEAVEDEALRGYAKDEEVCGYLRGPAGDPLLVDEGVRMENVAAKLHALDPERYFRSARTYFEFNGVKFQRAVDASSVEGRPVKVLYHSHLDAGAYFSPTDAAAMSMGKVPEVEGGPIEMGEGPQWPLAFLVTSVRVREGSNAPAIDEHGLFVWDGASRSFVRSTFTIVD